MMADGSVNSSTFLTAESDTLDTILNRGNTTTKSLSVGVATASRLEISSTFPRILLTDTNNNDDFSIDNADGTFRIRDRTNAADRFEIASNGKATLHNDVEIEGGLEVDGNISVGGTITYNDVTNVDSIGIITARKDIHVGAGLSVVGVSTFAGNTDLNGDLDVAGIATLGSSGSGSVDLQYQGTTKLETFSWGARTKGTVQALGGSVNSVHTGSQTASHSLELRNSDGLGGTKNLLELGHTSSNSFITGHVGNISINAPQVSISTDFSVGGNVTIGNAAGLSPNTNADNLVLGESTGNHGITILSGQSATGQLFFWRFC